MKVVYAPRALCDIDEILAYIHQRSPIGARNVSLAIEYTVHMCALNPRTGAKTDEPDVYRRPLGKYRYTIYDRALAGDDGIELARVSHERASRISASCQIMNSNSEVPHQRRGHT